MHEAENSAGAPSPARRIPVIGVMGSGTDEHAAAAEPLGAFLARAGVHLLTGGGGGVMASVARGFLSVEERRGLSLGILPASGAEHPDEPRRGYPNPWVELAVRTHLPLSGSSGTEALSRNHVNVLTADRVIALPGGAGTSSELTLARRYGRPAIAFVPGELAFPGLPPEVPRAVDLDEIAAFLGAPD